MMAIVSVFVSLPPYFLSGLFIVYLPSLRSQSSWLLVFQLFVLFFFLLQPKVILLSMGCLPLPPFSLT